MRPVPAAVSVTNRPVMFSLTPSSLSKIPLKVSLNSNVPESPYNSSQKFRPAAPAKRGAAGEEQRGLVETRLR